MTGQDFGVQVPVRMHVGLGLRVAGRSHRKATKLWTSHSTFEQQKLFWPRHIWRECCQDMLAKTALRCPKGITAEAHLPHQSGKALRVTLPDEPEGLDICHLEPLRSLTPLVINELSTTPVSDSQNGWKAWPLSSLLARVRDSITAPGLLTATMWKKNFWRAISSFLASIQCHQWRITALNGIKCRKSFHKP